MRTLVLEPSAQLTDPCTGLCMLWAPPSSAGSLSSWGPDASPGACGCRAMWHSMVLATVTLCILAAVGPDRSCSGACG